MRRDISIGVATALALMGAIAAVPRPSASASPRVERVASTVTTEEESALGWLARTPLVARHGGTVRADDSLARRVVGLGTRLAGTPTARGTPWRFAFHLLEDDEPLAFALPGGEVFVSRGMLYILGPEEGPLAATLAHQMGHVLARHVAEQLSTIPEARALLASLDSPTLDMRSVERTALALVERTRPDDDAEPEADALAARVLHEAGLDAAATIEVLHMEPAPAPLHGNPGNRVLREQRLAALVRQMR